MPNNTARKPASDGASSKNRKDYIVWDKEVPGLGKRIRPTRSVWLYQRRVAGKTVRKTLGDCNMVDVVQARQLALELCSEETTPAAADSPNVTLAAFVPRYLEDNAGRWKPLTAKSQHHGLRAFLPALGGRHLSSITRDDVVAARSDLTIAPTSINRAIAALSDLMRYAELVGVRQPETNPCKGLRRHQSDFKATYLTEGQYRAIGQALREAEGTVPAAVACIKFLALTGCRKSEALYLEWGWIDGPRAALPDAKSGPRSIWLGRPAQRLLATLPHSGLRVFVRADGTPLTVAALDATWAIVRAHADLPDLRLHDLRHSLASVAIGRGHSMDVISGLLGHLDRRSTAGYAHLNTGPVIAASARVGSHLANILAPARKLADMPEEAFEDYLRSRDRLPAWCEKRGIDHKTFAKALRLYRQARPRQGGRA